MTTSNHHQTIQVFDGKVMGTIRPPGSKSITNRALLLASLASGNSHLSGILDCDDTRVMVNALRKLGVHVVANWESKTCDVEGASGRFPVHEAFIDVKNSGTSIRFLTAVLAAQSGRFRLQGVPRMHQRPIGELAQVLNTLGAIVTTESVGGCPPVVVDGNGLEGGSVNISGNLSSQYLSGLLMASPLARTPVEIFVKGELVSKPYVRMTLENMRTFGVDVICNQETLDHFLIKPQLYQSQKFPIEPDATAASYFFAAAAICGGTTHVFGLGQNALQGDAHFVDVLEKMGCRVSWREDSIEVTGPAKIGVDVNMSSISDTVQTLAVVALFVDGPTTIRGVSHNRIKETDRIGNLAIELRKLGATVNEFDDGLTIVPGKLQGANLLTYDDHRMAMSLALVGLRVPNVSISNPQCVSKTYPHYFEDLELFLNRKT